MRHLAVALALQLRTPTQRFAGVWYINLDGMPERRAAMEESFAAAKLTVHRFSAVRPNATSMAEGGLHHAIYAALAHDPKLADAEKASGTVGCLASHIELLRQLQAAGHPDEVYMVTEDDHVPVPDLRERIQEVLAYMPPDWDTVRLDTWNGGWHSNLTNLPQVKPNLYSTNIPGCDDHKFQKEHYWRSCTYCGGTSVMLVPHSKIGKLVDLYSGKHGHVLSADCILARSDFKNYVLQWQLFTGIERFKGHSSIRTPES
jgi:GR25 family glycosyltransferase involved in LPS biosynthesis